MTSHTTMVDGQDEQYETCDDVSSRRDEAEREEPAEEQLYAKHDARQPEEQCPRLHGKHSISCESNVFVMGWECKVVLIAALNICYVTELPEPKGFAAF